MVKPFHWHSLLFLCYVGSIISSVVSKMVQISSRQNDLLMSKKRGHFQSPMCKSTVCVHSLLTLTLVHGGSWWKFYWRVFCIGKAETWEFILQPLSLGESLAMAIPERKVNSFASVAKISIWWLQYCVGRWMHLSTFCLFFTVLVPHTQKHTSSIRELFPHHSHRGMPCKDVLILQARLCWVLIRTLAINHRISLTLCWMCAWVCMRVKNFLLPRSQTKKHRRLLFSTRPKT